jgi:hypothetical protein
VAGRHHRLLRGHLLDPGQPLPARRRGDRRPRRREPLPRRAGRRPGTPRAARGLPDPRTGDDRLLRRPRRAVLAVEDGRRLPPGARRRGPGRAGAGTADVRRAHAGQARLRPRPSPRAGVRPVRRHPDGAPRRGRRAAHDLQGRAPRCGDGVAARGALGRRPAALPPRHAAGHGQRARREPVRPAAGARGPGVVHRHRHRADPAERRRRWPGCRRRRGLPGAGAARPGAARRGARGRRVRREPRVARALPALAHAAVHPGRGGRDGLHAAARAGRRRRAGGAPRRQRVLVPQLRRPPE